MIVQHLDLSNANLLENNSNSDGGSNSPSPILGSGGVKPKPSGGYNDISNNQADGKMWRLGKYRIADWELGKSTSNPNINGTWSSMFQDKIFSGGSNTKYSTIVIADNKIISAGIYDINGNLIEDFGITNSPLSFIDKKTIKATLPNGVASAITNGMELRFSKRLSPNNYYSSAYRKQLSESDFLAKQQAADSAAKSATSNVNINGTWVDGDGHIIHINSNRSNVVIMDYPSIPNVTISYLSPTSIKATFKGNQHVADVNSERILWDNGGSWVKVSDYSDSAPKPKVTFGGVGIPKVLPKEVPTPAPVIESKFLGFIPKKYKIPSIVLASAVGLFLIFK